MKKLIYFFCFFILVQNSSAQVDSIDAVFQKIITEKNDVTRIKKLGKEFSILQEQDPLKRIEMTQHLLVLAQKRKDRHVEAFATSLLGNENFEVGNTIKSLEYNIKALKIAEQLNNPELLAVIKTRLGGLYPLEQPTGLNYYKGSYAEAIKAGDDGVRTQAAFGIGRSFFWMKVFDSALFYLHISEQLQIKNKGGNAYTFFALGDIYAEMKNPTVALAYYRAAMHEAKKPVTIARSYIAIAKFYYKEKQTDSAILYAKKAIQAIQNYPYSKAVVLIPSKLLTDLYRNKNNDSAMKYADMYANTNEDQNGEKIVREKELLTFEEQLRQKTLADEKLKKEEQRHQNIQYGSITIGIILFITIFLLLSRTIVVNERFISFFAVLGFLVVFEFVNLLIHSWLADFTHESPLLMLLALVIIAAFLIEFRHRMEQFVKQKLVEKNKAIRLAAAKKTIQQLEKKTGQATKS